MVTVNAAWRVHVHSPPYCTFKPTAATKKEALKNVIGG